MLRRPAEKYGLEKFKELLATGEATQRIQAKS
jgi:hypothetical protein